MATSVNETHKPWLIKSALGFYCFVAAIGIIAAAIIIPNANINTVYMLVIITPIASFVLAILLRLSTQFIVKINLCYGDAYAISLILHSIGILASVIAGFLSWLVGLSHDQYIIFSVIIIFAISSEFLGQVIRVSDAVAIGRQKGALVYLAATPPGLLIIALIRRSFR